MSIDVIVHPDGRTEYSGPHLVTPPVPIPCPECQVPSPVLQVCTGYGYRPVAGYTMLCGHHFDTSVWRLRVVRAESVQTMILEPRCASC